MQQPPGGQPPGYQPPGGFQQGGFAQQPQGHQPQGQQPQGQQPQGQQPQGQQPWGQPPQGQGDPGHQATYGAPGQQPSSPGSTSSPFGGLGAGGPKAARAKGFLKSLFDFSFESFISPQVLKVLYGFWLFMLLPMTLFFLYTWYQALTWESYDFQTGERSWSPNFSLFCGSTVAFPFLVFSWVLMGRVLFERGILAFRNYDALCDVRDALRKSD